MWRLRRKEGRGGGTAVAEPLDGYAGTMAELRAEIDDLAAAHRSEPSRETERRLLQLRHLAGIRTLAEAPAGAELAVPDPDAGLPRAEPPELTPGELTPERLRAGILSHGCVLVRGLVGREAALGFAEEIERAFAAREGGGADGWYEEFQPHPHYGAVVGRDWIEEGGGVLAADSPPAAARMFELFRDARLEPLVDGYLGERSVISVHKTTLRKADPSVPGAWHQDGTFMGRVRSLNLWLALSRCGDVAPGLDIVPRRLDHLVATQTDDALLDIQVSQAKAVEAAAGAPILRPIFEPGDALLFDEMFLHQTASDPSMTKPRYALENWFFAGSSFPADYAPVAPW